MGFLGWYLAVGAAIFVGAVVIGRQEAELVVHRPLVAAPQEKGGKGITFDNRILIR